MENIVAQREPLVIETFSPVETAALGEKLAPLLQAGDILCLNGDLGAGKTSFSQGVALGLGVGDRVTSPTFTLINEYQGRLPFYHFDVYRLEAPEDMEDLGYEEYFYGSGVCLIEWANKIEPLLPRERLVITLTREETAENRRRITFSPLGERYQPLVEELSKLVCTGN